MKHLKKVKELEQRLDLYQSAVAYSSQQNIPSVNYYVETMLRCIDDVREELRNERISLRKEKLFKLSEL